MKDCQRHPRLSALTGFIIVIVGVTLLLNEFGFLPGFYIWKLWPLALVAVGVLKMVSACSIGNRIWGAILMTMGVLIFAHYFAYFPYGIERLWPLFIIGPGLAMLFDRNRRMRHVHGNGELQ